MRTSIRGECKLPTTIKDGMMRALVARNARRAQHARATPLRFTIQELDTIGTTGSVSNNQSYGHTWRPIKCPLPRYVARICKFFVRGDDIYLVGLANSGL